MASCLGNPGLTCAKAEGVNARGQKESTNNAKLLLQLGDTSEWPVTCSDLAPLAVAGSIPSTADGNGDVDLIQGFARYQLSEWPFQLVLRWLPHSALDTPAVSDGHVWLFGCSIRKARLQGASISLVILSTLFTQEPQTGLVLGPKRSPHPKAVLSCLEEEIECRQAEFLA